MGVAPSSTGTWVEEALKLIELIENVLLQEQVTVGELLGEVYRLMAIAQAASQLPVTKYFSSLFNDLLGSINGIIDRLEQLPPEYLLNQGEKESIRREVRWWRSCVEQVAAASHKLSRIILDLDHIIELLKFGSPWEAIRYPLDSIRGNLLILMEEYKECPLLEKLIKDFEAFYTEIETKLSSGISQKDRDRLASLCGTWKGMVYGVMRQCARSPPPQPPPVPPTPSWVLVFEVAGERFSLDASAFERLVIGRYDPGGLDPVLPNTVSDGLKILDEKGNILKVFNSVECRWGCLPDDEDCTHREHVEISRDPQGSLFLQVAPGAVLPVHYSYSPSEAPRRLAKGEKVTLEAGRPIYLWISGVYLDARRKDKRVPLKIVLEQGARLTSRLTHYR